MIPLAYVLAWRDSAPWQLPAQIEQDLVLSRAVVEIFSDPFLQERLAFRGGTALHKIYLRPPARYSEDIDLVQTIPEDIGPVIDRIRRVLAPILGDTPRRKIGDNVITMSYRFTSEGSPSIPLRLKVEINSREHFSVDPLVRIPFEVNNSWFTGKAECPTYTLNELLGTKLRALYQRRKGRDLFDLWLALERGEVSCEHIVRCFDQYMRHEGHVITHQAFIENVAAKLRSDEFRTDMHPLLAADISYDIDTAYNIVQSMLLTHMPTVGEPLPE